MPGRPIASLGSLSTPEGPVETWPVVPCDGVDWFVAPVLVQPIALRDVLATADAWECEIPSRALVEAIWRASDVKLDPWRLTRVPNDYDNGQSPEAIADHRRRVEAQIAGRDFRLLSGTGKDFVLHDGRLDLYGWHLLTGEPIERGRTSHDETYPGDYSQGLRLVRRVGWPVLRPYRVQVD